MKFQAWEKVWLASEAAQIAESYLAGDEVVPANIDQQFTENLKAVDEAYEELRPRLNNMPDQDAANQALYDSLLSSPYNETATSICFRSIARLRGQTEPNPKFIQPLEPLEDTFVNPTKEGYPSEDPALFIQVRSDKLEDRRIAQEKLIERYGGFVRQKALKLYLQLPKTSGVEVDDLIQEGMQALLHYAETYDSNLGFSFLTYAGKSIFWNMKDHYDDMASTVRVPRQQRLQITNVRAHFDSHWSRHLGAIQQEEIADVAGISPSMEVSRQRGINTVGDLMQVYFLSYCMGSLNTGYYSPQNIGPNNSYIINHSKGMDNLVNLNPPIEVDEMAIKELLKTEVNIALDLLKEREREILKLRFGLKDHYPRTLSDVADLYNVSYARIRQIESEALAKLRRPGPENDTLRNFYLQ